MIEIQSVPNDFEVHRAEWVMPMSAPPISNGAVLTHNGRITAVGPFALIRRDVPSGARLIDHGRAALLPALVNAHTHLELSSLEGKIPFPQSGFREWLTVLFKLRVILGHHSILEALHRGEAELFNSGTGFCADITNGGAVEHYLSRAWPAPTNTTPIAGGLTGDADYACRSGPCPRLTCGDTGSGSRDSGIDLQAPGRLVFLELLGFDLDSIAAAMPVNWPSTNQVPQFIPVPHSVYSVSPAIISESKTWTKAHRLPFSIHVAEHPDEIEFLRSGKGFCRELLEILGRWNPAWQPPYQTPIEYLDRLGALDSRTLLVHAVQMTEEDWEITARRNCTVVFCTRSNRNLGFGRPWIEKALGLGINCALGTDSLASNTDLNLFAEAGFVLDNYPSIEPGKVLEMITVNPARSLCCESDFGRIEPGANAHMLAVETGPCVSETNLAEAIILSGKEGTWKWVNSVQS